HGGTMHNKVVYRVARGLRTAGAVVLRFNYRGVSRSEGEYAHGEGELEDARTALGYLRGRYPDLPFTLAGFSFGSRIVLRLACGGAGARRVIAVGFPTTYKDRTFLDDCSVPRIFVQSTRDQYGAIAELEPLVASLPEPKKLILVEAQDHFFAGGLDRLEQEIAGL
ncbi:MAG: alpha/beta hydrolase, partial [Bryobacteraceae bacterium]